MHRKVHGKPRPGFYFGLPSQDQCRVRPTRQPFPRLIINLIEGGGRYSFPTPQADDQAAHVAHFTAAVYTSLSSALILSK